MGPRKIPELDGLRGLAVLLVLGRHAGREYANHLPGDAPTWLHPLLNGWMGVDLFFVLSGFLIGTNVLRLLADLSKATSSVFVHGGRYLARRGLRIVPAYYTVLLLVAAGLVPFYHYNRTGIGVSLGYHLLFLQDYLPSNIVIAFWSLGVEEKFYLTVPFVLLAIRRLPERFWTAAALSVSLASPLLRWLTWRQHPEIHTYGAFFDHLRSPFHLAADGLAVGLAIAIWRGRGGELGGRARAGVLVASSLVLAALLAQPFLLHPVTLYNVVPLFSVLALAFGAIVLATVSGPTFASPLLASAPLRRVGDLSYALYLVHMLFLTLAWSVAGDDGFFAFLGTFLAMSTVAAVALHVLVERPFLRLKARI